VKNLSGGVVEADVPQVGGVKQVGTKLVEGIDKRGGTDTKESCFGSFESVDGDGITSAKRKENRGSVFAR